MGALVSVALVHAAPAQGAGAGPEAGAEVVARVFPAVGATSPVLRRGLPATADTRPEAVPDGREVERVSGPTGPAATTAFGVIGFTVVAKPRPKPTPKPRPTPVPVREPARTSAAAPTAKADRAPQVASRSVSTRRSIPAQRGMSSNAVAVVNALRAQFPQISTYGGVRPGDPGDHGTGHAVDVMCTTAQGNEIAAYLQGRAGDLGIVYLIWRQRIWYPGGSWKAMGDRGNPTANHMDHVHVSVR